jgi:hypothetical protein
VEEPVAEEAAFGPTEEPHLDGHAGIFSRMKEWFEQL